MNDRLQKRLGSSEITELLRREIGTGVLVAKERLSPERLLAETYGVARGTIREALNQLAKEGLVEIRPGSGTFVTIDGCARRPLRPLPSNAQPAAKLTKGRESRHR